MLRTHPYEYTYDEDGRLTSDANKSITSICYNAIGMLGEDYVGQVKNFNLLWTSGSINDGLVYGNITLKRYTNHGVRAFDDTYDFDMHDSTSISTKLRNILTKIGSAIAGSGTSYPIKFYGTAKLNPIWPWTK